MKPEATVWSCAFGLYPRHVVGPEMIAEIVEDELVPLADAIRSLFSA